MPLSFGFGTSGPVAAASPSWASPPPAQWRTSLHDAFGHQSQSPHVQPFTHRHSFKPSPSPPPASVLNRRRRRSETPASDDSFDAMEIAKRPKREIKDLRRPSLSLIDSREKSDSVMSDVDLGKMLASLPKPALLSILNSLAQQQPTLKPAILALIPPPSLESFTTSLTTLEKRVLYSAPRGVGLRDEYVWSRVRSSLEEYVSEGRQFLTVFCPPSTSSPGPSGSTVNETLHPSTTFTFLATLTASIRRIEDILPIPQSSNDPHLYRSNPNDPLSSHLLPSLLNHWHLFITKISHNVNQLGRIISAETVRSWFRQLESLNQSNRNDRLSTRAIEGVRERLVKEIGWTVGIRPLNNLSSTDDMEDDVEL